MTDTWRERLGQTQHGNYLLTVLPDGYRLWRVGADGEIADVGLTDRSLLSLFAYLNDEAQGRKEAEAQS